MNNKFPYIPASSTFQILQDLTVDSVVPRYLEKIIGSLVFWHAEPISITRVILLGIAPSKTGNLLSKSRIVL
jgi:hypothetical protein